MQITIQPTPNPAALKFIGDTLRFPGPRSFTSAAAASSDPLASRIFAVEGVDSVFMTANFVTVNRRGDASWDAIVPAVTAILEAL